MFFMGSLYHEKRTNDVLIMFLCQNSLYDGPDVHDVITQDGTLVFKDTISIQTRISGTFIN